MKTMLIVLLCMALSTIAYAGSLTISTTAAEDSRMAKAYGKQLNTQDLTDPKNPVARDATEAEIKAAVIQCLSQVVYAQERVIARKAANASIQSFSPN